MGSISLKATLGCLTFLTIYWCITWLATLDPDDSLPYEKQVRSISHEITKAIEGDSTDPDYHLAAIRRLDTSYLGLVRSHLEAIPVGTQEWTEARLIVKKLMNQEKLQYADVGPGQRDTFAFNLESMILQKWHTRCSVRALGSRCEDLLIEHERMDEGMAGEIFRVAMLDDAQASLGFRRITFSNPRTGQSWDCRVESGRVLIKE